jgi:hypothetical protein
MDEDPLPETRHLTEAMALAAVEWFGTLISMRPPVAVVFTVWASMPAAEG